MWPARCSTGAGSLEESRASLPFLAVLPGPPQGTWGCPANGRATKFLRIWDSTWIIITFFFFFFEKGPHLDHLLEEISLLTDSSSPQIEHKEKEWYFVKGSQENIIVV